jgi:hypothetical protein
VAVGVDGEGFAQEPLHGIGGRGIRAARVLPSEALDLLEDGLSDGHPLEAAARQAASCNTFTGKVLEPHYCSNFISLWHYCGNEACPMAARYKAVNLKPDLLDDLRAAVESGALDHLAVRSVPHALELGARRLLQEARPAPEPVVA